MKFSSSLAVALGLSVAIISGCDAVGTNQSPSTQEADAAPQIELSREIPINIKMLPSDKPTMYTANGDTSGNE